MSTALNHAGAQLLVISLVSGCGNPFSVPTVTSYPLEKTADGRWLPLEPTEYMVDVKGQRVVRETAGFISRSDNCAIKDVNNWQCQEDGGKWVFGFRDGDYWEVTPTNRSRGETRHVSSFEWWIENVKWSLDQS